MIIGLLIFSIIVSSIMIVDLYNEIGSLYDYEVLKAITEAFADID